MVSHRVVLTQTPAAIKSVQKIINIHWQFTDERLLTDTETDAAILEAATLHTRQQTDQRILRQFRFDCAIRAADVEISRLLVQWNECPV